MRSGKVRVLTAAAVLAAFGAVTVTFVSGGGRTTASAQAGLDQFVPIDQVAPNVVVPAAQRNASTGVFSVDCGTNGNGKFSPDNPVAQPGIKNGAEHVHDFVGNLAITADTGDEALAASGTTCKNGDRSSYFWPVVRIDRSVRANAQPLAADAAPTMSCPRVADRLPALPKAAAEQVRQDIAELDAQTRQANQRLTATKGRIDATFNNSVVGPLRTRRATLLSRIEKTVARSGARSPGLVSLADCEVSYDALHAGHNAAKKAKAGTGAATTLAATPAVACPSVRDRLPDIPRQAVDEVNRNLELLDRQIAEADERLVSSKGQGGPNFVDNAIMGPLKDKRVATLDRIAIAIGRHAERPTGLDAFAPCTLRNGAPADNDDAQADGDNNGDAGAEASPAPLPEPEGPNLELPNNTGGIVRPAAVIIEYRGNPTTKVQAMPRFLRALTGDAKPTSRGPANARATWTCSGFTERLSTKYPICPGNSQVVRVQDFPGCWDGENIDSTNHRDHLAFADARTGACKAGFVAIPQLRISIAYDIPRDVQDKGQFALDSFPEENHNPFSDHNDFINVNSEAQMNKIVSCVNTGRGCR